MHKEINPAIIKNLFTGKIERSENYNFLFCHYMTKSRDWLKPEVPGNSRKNRKQGYLPCLHF